MVRSLILQNFRNYSRRQAEFESGINVVIGKNGRGKTNLLEALFFLLQGRSMRTSEAKEMVKNGEEMAVLEGRLEAEGEKTIRKTISGEGAIKQGSKQMNLSAVCFQPDDIWMVKGGPEARRKSLDEVILEMRKGYRETLREYQRVLRQRNEAIKMVRKGIKGREYMRNWNSLLIKAGREVIEERVDTAARMEEEMAENGDRWGLGEAGLKYYTTLGGEAGDTAKVVEKVERMEEAEIRRGTTLLGPHRDELLFTLGGKNVRRECSQGEQKLVAVMWRLAQGRLLARTAGREVILLMDDLLSELDEDNRGMVMKEMEGWRQVVVTTTDDREEYVGLKKIILA